MANLNKVHIIGNLTKDPELRNTARGTPCCEISVAINRSYKSVEGEKTEEVTYVDILLWSRLAEIGGKYLAKGRSVYISGRLQLDTWEDRQTGQKRSRLRVIGEDLQLLDRREAAVAKEPEPEPETEISISF